MKRRIFAMMLAAAMVLSLAACGNNNSSGSSSGGSSSSQGNASSGDGSQPDGSGDASAPVEVTLNKTEVTLNKAGATFQLRYTAQPDGVEAFFSTSDESVATVDGEGVITAVAPGKAVITVTLGSELAEASCTVTCDWKDSQLAPAPDNKPADKPAEPSKPTEPSPAPAAKVDLQKFYDDTTGKYEFGMLELADQDILDMVYAGLSDIDAEQMLVYVCMISMNNGEFGLVQVKDSADVDTVKAIFQARIDYMVGDGNGPGGAQYPMAMDQWEFNSRIVSNGNYVMMIVHENCDDIVNAFNALF